jgi:hypothetical protein
MPNRLVVAWPLYRTVSVSWFLTWGQMQRGPVVAQVSTHGIYLTEAMQTLVDMTFAQVGGDWDYLVIYEHDMIPPLNAFERMAQYGDEHDIVGTCYFGRDYPHAVMAYMQTDYPLYNQLGPETVKAMVEAPALYEVDAVAMGFTAIHKRVFENWDKNTPMWEAQPPLKGHDLWFCHAAKQQGFRVWLDSGIGCAHLSEVPISYSDNQRCWTEISQSTGTDDMSPPNIAVGGAISYVN